MQQTWTGALHNQSSQPFLPPKALIISQPDGHSRNKKGVSRVGILPRKGPTTSLEGWCSYGRCLCDVLETVREGSIEFAVLDPAGLSSPISAHLLGTEVSLSMAFDRYLVAFAVSHLLELSFVWRPSPVPHGRPWHRPCTSHLCFSHSLPRCVYRSLHTKILRSFFLSELLARSFQLQL